MTSQTVPKVTGRKPRYRITSSFGHSVVLSLLVLAQLSDPLRSQALSSPPLPHDPEHAEKARHWCGIHLSRNELVAALSDGDYAVARDPKDSAALSNRGSVWLAANEPSRALRDFDAAIELSPHDPELHFNRAIAHGRLGNGERAVGDYTEAIRLNPDFAIAYHNRGVEFEQRGRLDDARADFEHALRISPDLARKQGVSGASNALAGPIPHLSRLEVPHHLKGNIGERGSANTWLFLACAITHTAIAELALMTRITCSTPAPCRSGGCARRPRWGRGPASPLPSPARARRHLRQRAHFFASLA